MIAFMIACLIGLAFMALNSFMIHCTMKLHEKGTINITFRNFMIYHCVAYIYGTFFLIINQSTDIFQYTLPIDIFYIGMYFMVVAMPAIVIPIAWGFPWTGNRTPSFELSYCLSLSLLNIFIFYIIYRIGHIDVKTILQTKKLDQINKQIQLTKNQGEFLRKMSQKLKRVRQFKKTKPEIEYTPGIKQFFVANTNDLPQSLTIDNRLQRCDTDTCKTSNNGRAVYILKDKKVRSPQLKIGTKPILGGQRFAGKPADDTIHFYDFKPISQQDLLKFDGLLDAEIKKFQGLLQTPLPPQASIATA